jgi:signal transduction histidine kinase
VSVHTERNLHLPGGTLPVALAGSRVLDEEGRLIGAMETITDLTELRKMQAEMQQDRVLRALGEMAATVAHEIRNPLAGIGGYAGLLSRGIPNDDPKRKLIDKIIGGVSSLNKIVSNLLVYTRKTSLQKQRTDLVAWMEGIVAHAEVEVEHDQIPVRIQRDFPAEPLWAEIDPERLQQVALNLIQNGIQAIEGEGALSVRLSAEGDLAKIQIEDTGKGIEAAQLEQIWTPFFTTKEQGTGLGLAIVKKIIEAHNGTVCVDSTVGAGTTFTIVVPL